MSARRAKVVTSIDDAGEGRYKIVAANGATVAVGEGYRGRKPSECHAKARRGAEALIKAAVDIAAQGDAAYHSA